MLASVVEALQTIDYAWKTVISAYSNIINNTHLTWINNAAINHLTILATLSQATD